MQRFGTRLILLLFLGCSLEAYSQKKAYFIDGYHGGVWGHYPEWNTRFMVDQLQKNPNWYINIEIEPDTWDTAAVKDPAALADFKKIFADQSYKGRIEYVNPSYGQSYLYNISGESIIRQFYYGQKKVLSHFPEAVFTSYSSEEPCFTSALPMILSSYGYKYASLKNPNTCWGGYTRAYGGELVNWLGPDNKSILITVPRYEVEALQKNSTWQTIAWNNSKEYINASFKYGIENPVGMCLQDAGWKNGPWLGPDASRDYSPAEYRTWRDYIANYSIKTPKQNWKFSQEDMQVSLVWGSQILQRLAQQVRAAENRAVVAEKIAALASLTKQTSWPAEPFERAWQPLLLAQHHDCWIVPYNRKFNTNWAGLVKIWTNTTTRISDSIINSVTGSSTIQLTSLPGNVRVYNTLGSNRDEWVTIVLPADEAGNWQVINSQGKTVASQLLSPDSAGVQKMIFKASVPSFGYNDYSIKEGKSVSGQKGITKRTDGTFVMESDLYRIVLDPAKGGRIKSLVVKYLANKEFVDVKNDFGFNELRGNFFKDGGRKSSADQPATITVLDDGDAVKKVAVDGTISGHPYRQVITLVNGQKRIEFTVRVNWKDNPGIGNSYAQDAKWDQRDYRKAFYDDRDKLIVSFPTPLNNQKIYKDAPFDVTESKLGNTFFGTWDSIKHNILLHWVDVADQQNSYGLAVLSDHTTSYVHGKNHPLSLTLQYSGMGLWGRNYTITAPMVVNYALVPHKGKWDAGGIYSESEKWNEPLTGVALTENDPKAKSGFTGLNTGSYHLSSVLVDGKDLLARLYNAEGSNTASKIIIPSAAEKVSIVELDGKEKENLNVQKDNTGKSYVMVTIPRLGFRTLKISGTIQ